MSNLAVASGTVPALAMSEDELLSVLESSLYPGARLASIKLVISWCRAAGKDPLKRPVHIVPMRVKKAGGGRDDYEWRDVVMPGIADYRIDAARTGQHAGNGDAVFGPTRTMQLGSTEFEYPEWCEFTVYRLLGGEPRPFSSGRVRWLESYATAGKDSDAPNAMWRKRPFGQLEKCAEAMALRRAFPEVGANPTAEEMEGRVIDADGVEVVVPEGVGSRGVKTPRRRSEPAVDAPPALADDPSQSAAGFQKAGDAAERVAAIAARANGKAAAEPAPSEGSSKLAGEGERAYLKRKAGDRLDEVLGEVGCGSLEKLTAEQFDAARKVVASWE